MDRTKLIDGLKEEKQKLVAAVTAIDTTILGLGGDEGREAPVKRSAGRPKTAEKAVQGDEPRRGPGRPRGSGSSRPGADNGGMS